MSTESKSSKVAYLALVIALLSMMGAVGNFIFSVWRHQQAEKTEINFQAEMAHNSKVEIIDSNLFMALDKESKLSGAGDLKTFQKMIPQIIAEGGVYFPKVLTLYAECRITNLSKKPITLEEIQGLVTFGEEGSGIVNGPFLHGIFKPEGGQIQLPYLLKEQEQVFWYVKIGYPLTPELLKVSDQYIPDIDKVGVSDVYEIFLKKGYDLNDFSKNRPSKMAIRIKTADANEYEEEIDFPFLFIGLSKPDDS